MKKVLVLLAVVLGLGTSVVFAEGVKDAKKEQTVKKSPDFIEIYMNDVPETIMDTLVMLRLKWLRMSILTSSTRARGPSLYAISRTTFSSPV